MCYRALQGLPPKYHTRLKHEGRLLAVLQGDTHKEAHDRAERLASALSLSCYSIEAA
jgi:hypothetical protein